MRGAFQIFTLFKIPVRIHWSFLILIAWVVYSSFSQGGDVSYTVWSSLLVITIFFCVIMHEYGHALTARRYGVQTKDIILSPIGGIARLNKLPEKPLQEFFVAIAGPMVNIGISLILAPIILIFFSTETQQLWDIIRGAGLPSEEESAHFFAYYAPSIFFLNLILAGFNMLPAFPMDGGRIFRALLSIRLGRLRATRIAARFGQIIAVLLAIYGIWNFNLITVLIAAFVFLTATQEYRSIKWEAILSKYNIAAAMRPLTLQIHPDTPLSIPFEALQRSVAQHFLITDSETNQAVGALSGQAMLNFLKQAENNIQAEPVRQYMMPPPPAIYEHYSLKQAFELLHLNPVAFLTVLSSTGSIIGTIDAQAIQNFVRLQAKLKK